MNLEEINFAAKYLKKNCNCSNCNKKFNLQNIHLLAATNNEGLFEAKCHNCETNTIINIVVGHEMEHMSLPRQHQNISENEILDMKNFLNKFDGNFKKLFQK